MYLDVIIGHCVYISCIIIVTYINESLVHWKICNIIRYDMNEEVLGLTTVKIHTVVGLIAVHISYLGVGCVKVRYRARSGRVFRMSWAICWIFRLLTTTARRFSLLWWRFGGFNWRARKRGSDYVSVRLQFIELHRYMHTYQVVPNEPGYSPPSLSWQGPFDGQLV